MSNSLELLSYSSIRTDHIIHSLVALDTVADDDRDDDGNCLAVRLCHMNGAWTRVVCDYTVHMPEAEGLASYHAVDVAKHRRSKFGGILHTPDASVTIFQTGAYVEALLHTSSDDRNCDDSSSGKVVRLTHAVELQPLTRFCVAIGFRRVLAAGRGRESDGRASVLLVIDTCDNLRTCVVSQPLQPPYEPRFMLRLRRAEGMNCYAATVSHDGTMVATAEALQRRAFGGGCDGGETTATYFIALYSMLDGHVLRLFDTGYSSHLATLDYHWDALLSFHPNDGTFVAFAAHGNVAAFDIASGREAVRVRDLADFELNAIALTRNGFFVVAHGRMLTTYDCRERLSTRPWRPTPESCHHWPASFRAALNGVLAMHGGSGSCTQWRRLPLELVCLVMSQSRRQEWPL